MASDNCAVGPDGQLLDTSKITWYNDPDDDMPMALTTTLPSMVQVLRSSGLKVRRAQVDFATSRMAEVFGVSKD